MAQSPRVSKKVLLITCLGSVLSTVAGHTHANPQQAPTLRSHSAESTANLQLAQTKRSDDDLNVTTDGAPANPAKESGDLNVTTDDADANAAKRNGDLNVITDDAEINEAKREGHLNVTAETAAMISDLDANGDGMLSKDEAQNVPTLLQKWDDLDGDVDGHLDASELANYK